MILRILIAAALTALLAACGSNGSPSGSDIRTAFEQDLPGLLQLKDFSLEQHRNTGTAEQPVWVARVVANVATREATFDIDTVEEGVRILKPVHAAGAGFALYGTVRSERMGDTWRHSFQRDGSSNPVLGRPRTDYGPDALIAGSPEANALLARIEQQRERERIERETRLAEQAMERKRADEAEAAKRRRIEEAVSRHGAGFAPRTLADLAWELVRGSGEKRALLVTAKAHGGDVIGTDRYNGKSDFARSVVHAGLLKDGETGIVEISAFDERVRPVGSPRNGVDSINGSDNRNIGYTMRLLERIE